MFTPTALAHVHARTHESLVGLIDHGAAFGSQALDHEHEGFGYRTVRLQLHHIIGCEQYCLVLVSCSAPGADAPRDSTASSELWSLPPDADILSSGRAQC